MVLAIEQGLMVEYHQSLILEKLIQNPQSEYKNLNRIVLDIKNVIPSELSSGNIHPEPPVRIQEPK